MKSKNTRRLVPLLLGGIFAVSETAWAQSVIVPLPPISVTPPAVQEAPPSPLQVFSQQNPISSFPDEDQPLQWGPVTFRPHVSYQFVDALGVQSSPGQSHDTIIQSFAPGLMLVITPHWTLDYTPNFTFYSDNSFQNNVAHTVTLTGGGSYQNWDFGLAQGFSYSSAPQVETGGQTVQRNYSTALTASCPLNSKLSLDLGLDQALNYPSGFQSSQSWSTMDWLRYAFWSRFNVSIGAGFGYVNATPNTVFEQAQARVGWRATDKISFQVSGGAQFSQFTEGGESPLSTFIYSAAIQYQPFEHTKISLGANQSLTPSYYQNQVSVVNSINGGINQRLLGKLFLDVGASYSWNNYVAAAPGVTTVSSSEFYTVNVGLNTTFLKRGTIGVFYNYSDNITAQSGLSFTSSQVGFSVGFRY